MSRKPKLIARQHLLPSLHWLLGEIVATGDFSEIDIVGKPYSTVPGVLEGLPASVHIQSSIEKCFEPWRGHDALVILDEGGGLHDAVPPELIGCVAGVEQTTAGMRSPWRYPTVLVCRSAAKLFFEAQIIARGIVRKLHGLGLLPSARVGIVGLGAVGAELARELLRQGVQVVGSDLRQAPHDLCHIVCSTSELLDRADLILGCTGRDSLGIHELEKIGRPKTLISCSSANLEFASIATALPFTGDYASIEGTIGSTPVRILNAGYPINFDRQTEWEREAEIRLTRMLMLQGLFQAIALIGTNARGVMLDPSSQLQIVERWLEHVPDRSSIRMPHSLDEGFFRAHSEGECMTEATRKYALHSTTPGALAQMRSHIEPYNTDIMGLPIAVLPGVWSPAYDWSSLFYVENMPDVRDRDFLEIGCGTGVISVFAARSGARSVTASDVNPLALENTKLNFTRFGVCNARIVQSDCFSDIVGLFDLITWNAPYHGNHPNDDLERGCSDEKYLGIRAFFAGVNKHLNQGGMVVFGFSESGDLSLIRSLIASAGFTITRTLSDWRADYNCMLFELRRESELTPRP